jgi:NitT/TauT family transport system ATP-binding protein
LESGAVVAMPEAHGAGLPPKIVVDCAGVTVEYGGNPILGPLDLRVAEGEFLTILGPSGAGKTTLLRVLGGMRAPDCGTVARPAGPIAWVAQEHNIFPWMTVLRNAAFTLEMAGVAKAEREAKARVILERLGLAGREEAWPRQLSTGMKQRVALARAFLGDPALLLMDEPFASLDTARRQSLQEELLGLWDRTRAPVVFVTHDVDEAVFLSQRILMLGDRPATVQAEIPVHLPYPRHFAVTLTDEFLQIKRSVYRHLGLSGDAANHAG